MTMAMTTGKVLQPGFPRGWGLLGPVLAVIAVWLALLEIPEAPVPQLDASWQQVLVHAHEQQAAFGNGIIFTAGPLGFLTSRFYLPDSLPLKLAWEFGGKLLLAGVFVGLTGFLGRWRRVTVILVTVVLAPLFSDVFYTVLLTLLVLRWLMSGNRTRWHFATALVLLSFLAQLKFTYCLLAAAGVGLAALEHLRRHQSREALVLLGGFIGAFLGWWLLGGQNPIRLPDYFRYSWAISSGYPWAMSFEESWPVFFAGAGLATLALLVLSSMLRAAPAPRGEVVAPVLFLAAVWFFTWKHGFTRADGHVLGFFLFSILIGIALADLAPALHRRWFEFVAPLGLFGFWLAEPALLRSAPGGMVDRFRVAGFHLLHASAIRPDFAANFAARSRTHELPRLRAAIGQGTVDLFNYEQGLLFLNGLNYRPRPIFQSYSAYTGSLLQKNAGFYRRPTAPDFAIVRVGSIDERYPTQDDSLVLAELPTRYDFMLQEGESVLLRKKASAPAGELRRVAVAEHGVALGQEVAAPDAAGHPLWLEASFPLSWIGKLRALLYRPPQLFIVTTDSRGQEYRHRVVPTIASTGFVIQPMVLSSEDFADFVRGRGTKALRSLRFEPASAAEAEFWAPGQVRFSQLPELPLAMINPMQALVDAGICNVAPDSVTSDTTVEYITLPAARRALLVHATGTIAFTRPEPARRLTGEFGLTEGAYTGANRTDGAEFAVEAEDASGRTQVLWRRTLEPLTTAADRGSQAFAVELPPDTVRVRLQTRTGAKGDGSWDWTYWGAIAFQP